MTAQLASVTQHIRAGATIITPNVRLSRYLAQQYDLAQHKNANSAWVAADIVPIGLFYSRLVQRLAPQKVLLSAAQAQTIWENVIRASPVANGLMSVPQAARLAQEAWQQTCSWDLLSRMKQMAVHDDNLAFLTWVSAVTKTLRDNEWLDDAGLPDALLKILADTTLSAYAVLPEKICLYGFDLETPQQQRFFSTLQLRSITVFRTHLQDANTPANPSRMACDTAAQEILNAAHWAKRLQDQSTHKLRLAFVVPDLASRKNAIVRTLTDTFFPNARAQLDFNQNGRTLTNTAFNVSLGEPLSRYAPIHDALLLLRIGLSTTSPIPWDEISQALLSPFIHGAAAESGTRYRLDALMRRYGGFQSSFSTLYAWLSRPDKETPAALLDVFNTVQKIRIAHGIEATHLTTLTKTRQPKLTLSPAKWCTLVWQVLDAWGYPGDLKLDSQAFQLLTKFEALIAEFAKLNQTVLADAFDADTMLSALSQLAAQTQFQAEALSQEPLVHVLGVLESTAQHFDGIWVMGMRADAWPLPISPNPFIPQALQRLANMPEGAHAASHALDAAITKNWIGACNEICFSYVLAADGAESADSTTVCSSLVAQYPQKIADNFDAQASTQPLIPIIETDLLCLVQGQKIRGGAALWRDFAACPFKAYARHRLQTTELATPEPGLSAAQRGTLVHRALALFWEATYTHTALCAQTPDERHTAIHRCVARTISEAQTRLPALSYAMAEIEAQRLTRLLTLWLAMEETRAPFSVEEIESKRDLTIAGLAVNLTLDRLDALEDGTVAIIDYKSGKPSITTWLGPRMDEPQLPLYCAASDAHVSAVAFGSVRRQQNSSSYAITGFIGVSAVANLLPNVATVEQQSRAFAATTSNWDELTVQWEKATTAIAVQFMQGHTVIAPKAGNATCAQCACQPICRIAERTERAREAARNDDAELADAQSHE